MEGNFLMEFKKEKLYTRNNSAELPVYGYRSVFGDIANCLNYTNYLCSQEFNLQASLQFSEPDSNDPAAFPPKPGDPDFAEKMAAHEQRKKFSEAWRECGLVKTDFNMVVAAVSSLLGEDLLSYLRTRQEDIQLRSKYLYRFDDGQVAYDCSLGERFTGPMIPLVIKKIITVWDSLPALERGFKSEFAKKAWADLLAYEEIKAADEANLSDLLERPYEDLVTEEIIDSLPGPKIEDLEPEDVPGKVGFESVPMDTESTEPTQMEVEGGSVDPVSTKDEVTEDAESGRCSCPICSFAKLKVILWPRLVFHEHCIVVCFRFHLTNQETLLTPQAFKASQESLHGSGATRSLGLGLWCPGLEFRAPAG